MASRAQLETQLATAKKRLALYLKREEDMLDGGVKSYGVGTRNLSRYDTDLAKIQDAISKLQKEVANLEGQIAGGKARKVVSAVPREW